MALVRIKATKSVTWWVGIGVFFFGALTFWVARGYGRAGIMPGMAAISIMVLSVVHTIYGLAYGVIANDEEWHDADARASYVRRRLIYTLTAVAVGIAIWIVGFHIALPLFLLLFMGLTLRQWLTGVILGVAIWCFTYLVLHNMLHIIFPPSLLHKWLIANGYY